MILTEKDLYFKFITKKDTNFILSLYNSSYSKIALSETFSDQYPFSNPTFIDWIDDIRSNYKYLKTKNVSKIKTIIIIIYSKNKKIGFIQLNNINKKSKQLEIGIVIKKEFKGNGFGKRSIDRICDFIFKNFNIIKIKASIRNDNFISKKLFEKCGFLRSNKKEEYFVIDNFYSFNVFVKSNI